MPKQKNTLKVPADYPSIGAALNAAKPGDTIRVSKGTYHEKVHITTSGLILEGQDGAVIQIDDSLFQSSDKIPGDRRLIYTWLDNRRPGKPRLPCGHVYRSSEDNRLYFRAQW